MDKIKLADLHIHGGHGIDLMRADHNKIRELSALLKAEGVTVWTPTLIGDSLNIMEDRVKQIALAAESCPEMIGIHIEGPFISPQKSGVLPKESIIPCDTKYFDVLSDFGLPLRFTIAPESENSLRFTEYVTARGGIITLGHSSDDGTMTRAAIKAGASGFTHLFNAMRGIHHRNGSIAQTALLSGLPCEIICDKNHLSPDTIQMIYKTIGLENVILITDAMSAMQSGIGEYDFCGKKVYYNGQTVSVDGILAGSCITAAKALDNFCEITKTDKKSVAEATLKNSLKLMNMA